jgi:hypothetical protein
MKLAIKKGSTSVALYVFIADSSSTVGAGKTGLAFDTASLVAYYVRPLASATSITLATQTVTGAWSSGGFVEVSVANMPGVYRFDIPDAALATGVNSVVVMLKGASGMAPLVLEVELVAYDPQDAAGLGLSRVDASISSRSTYAGADTAGTTTLLARVPAALVGGRMDAVVGAMATDTLTADALNADAVAEIQSGLSTLNAAGVRSAVGLASANLDTQLDALPTAAEAAAAVWASGTRTLSSFGTLVADLATAVWAAAARTLTAFGFTPSLDAAYDPAKTAAQAADIPTAVEIADAILGRNLAGGSNGGRTVQDSLRAQRNRVVVTPVSATEATLTVYAENDVTVAWTATVALTAGASPITGVDPS